MGFISCFNGEVHFKNIKYDTTVDNDFRKLKLLSIFMLISKFIIIFSVFLTIIKNSLYLISTKKIKNFKYLLLKIPLGILIIGNFIYNTNFNFLDESDALSKTVKNSKGFEEMWHLENYEQGYLLVLSSNNTMLDSTFNSNFDITLIKDSQFSVKIISYFIIALTCTKLSYKRFFELLFFVLSSTILVPSTTFLHFAIQISIFGNEGMCNDLELLNWECQIFRQSCIKLHLKNPYCCLNTIRDKNFKIIDNGKEFHIEESDDGSFNKANFMKYFYGAPIWDDNWFNDVHFSDMNWDLFKFVKSIPYLFDRQGYTKDFELFSKFYKHVKEKGKINFQIWLKDYKKLPIKTFYRLGSYLSINLKSRNQFDKGKFDDSILIVSNKVKMKKRKVTKEIKSSKTESLDLDRKIISIDIVFKEQVNTISEHNLTNLRNIKARTMNKNIIRNLDEVEYLPLLSKNKNFSVVQKKINKIKSVSKKFDDKKREYKKLCKEKDLIINSILVNNFLTEKKVVKLSTHNTKVFLAGSYFTDNLNKLNELLNFLNFWSKKNSVLSELTNKINKIESSVNNDGFEKLWLINRNINDFMKKKEKDKKIRQLHNKYKNALSEISPGLREFYSNRENLIFNQGKNINFEVDVYLKIMKNISKDNLIVAIHDLKPILGMLNDEKLSLDKLKEFKLKFNYN